MKKGIKKIDQIDFSAGTLEDSIFISANDLMIFNLEKYMNAKRMKKLSKATLRITFSVLILVLLERSLSNKN